MSPGFVRFVFEQVFGLNPQGRLGIEDLIIRSPRDEKEDLKPFKARLSVVLGVSKGPQLGERYSL